jgi:predicted RNA-binding protein associated with RNAse of E/G family
VSVHPPKQETFDLVAHTNTDPKGIVRAVDEYRVTPWGLYMARPTPGRTQFHYLQSWLLPSLGLRASVFHFNPGYERPQDYYLDIGRIAVGETVWHTEDHYLDLVVYAGDRTDLVDVDELLAAHRDGLLTTQTAEETLQRAVVAVEGLAAHNHDLNAWLAASGMPLTWH